MAALTAAELARVARWYQRDPAMGAAAFTKPDLIAAVAALDTFMDTNASSINSALPLPFRTSATTAQKALLLALIVMRRYGANPLQGGD